MSAICIAQHVLRWLRTNDAQRMIAHATVLDTAAEEGRGNGLIAQQRRVLRILPRDDSKIISIPDCRRLD